MANHYPRGKRAKNDTKPETTAKYYLTNAKLLPAVIRAKTIGKMTDELAEMLLMLTRKYAQRPCFNGYTYKDDMISEAITNLCLNALKFNSDKYDNPFAYYTTCINSSFLQFLNVEKKHRRIRDMLLIDVGENPSFNFTVDSHKQEGGEFTGELRELKQQIEEAKVRTVEEAALAVKIAEEKRVQAIKDREEALKMSESETVRDLEYVEPELQEAALLTYDE